MKKNTELFRRLFKKIVLLTVGIPLIFFSCNEDEFTLKNNFIESQSHVILNDTFPVKLSTVILDSLPTSGTTTLLVGRYKDDYFGEVSSKGFIQIGIPEINDVEEKDVFDSVKLIIYHNGYSYGDTSKKQHITVHKLAEPIETDDEGYVYNSTHINYDKDSIGSIDYIPFPYKTDSIVININNSVGTDLFEKLKDKSEYVSSESKFLNYFNGLALIADKTTNNVVMGYKADEGDVKLRLYTHRVTETPKSIIYDFSLINIEKQFNQVTHDFSGTDLSIIQDQQQPIHSSETGNKAFVQGSIGLMTRVRFPSLAEILLFERSAILKVQLVLSPEKTSYSEFSLPEELILYETDKNNSFGDVLYGDDRDVLVPEFILDELYHEETSYTFDITSYIKNELEDSYFDVNHGLLINVSSDKFLASLERLTLSTDSSKLKLKIYYLNY